ncbi:TIGR04222 domain-containing membrane protein [Streptomyces sp. NPDC059909]|uniref:TIGR04222 domain-containing membrane protein n=1 Tax=Streptomyces sp. NPDC059909 TaxID=3346998 RepID=UPI0036530016
MVFNVIAVLVTVAVAVSSTLLISRLSAARSSGPGGPVHDLMEVAFLNGGPARVVDTALAAMASDGRIMIGGPGIVAVQRPVAHDPVERAVLHETAAAPHGALHTMRLAVMRSPAVQEIGDALAARGLMVEPQALRPWHRWAVAQALCCVLLLPMSIVLTIAQFAMREGVDDIPVPFVVKVLPAFFGGLIIGLACSAKARRKVTEAGGRAAAEYAMAHVYAADAGHRVALGGLRALPDPLLRAQLVAAARLVRTGHARPVGGHGPDGVLIPATDDIVWCASTDPGSGGSGGGGCGGAGGSSCGGGSGGGSCSSGCGGSSGGGGGSSCGSSSGGGSSCGGGSSSSCGGGSSSS